MIVCLFVCLYSERDGHFLDGLPAPGEFISSQLVRYCLFVCLFVHSPFLFILFTLIFIM